MKEWSLRWAASIGKKERLYGQSRESVQQHWEPPTPGEPEQGLIYLLTKAKLKCSYHNISSSKKKNLHCIHIPPPPTSLHQVLNLIISYKPGPGIKAKSAPWSTVTEWLLLSGPSKGAAGNTSYKIKVAMYFLLPFWNGFKVTMTFIFYLDEINLFFRSKTAFFS